MRCKTSPLNPLSIVERGRETTLKHGFLPLLQSGEGGRGDEVKKINTPSFLTNNHYCVPTHRDGCIAIEVNDDYF
jgi:hypothetical protein